MQPVVELTVVADAIFDDALRNSARIAKFADQAERETYAEKDARLRRTIDEAGQRLFASQFVEQHLYSDWDWWPDHTRRVEASTVAFTQQYFDELRALLKGDYADWRVVVAVYGDLDDSTSLI